MFARAWVLLSMAVFRLWPLLGLGIYARHHPMPQTSWIAAFALTVGMVLIAQVSAARCSSQRLSHTHGLLVVGVAMSTGWMFVDAVLVPAAVTATLLMSSLLALSPQSPAHYLALVRWVASRRIRQ